MKFHRITCCQKHLVYRDLSNVRLPWEGNHWDRFRDIYKDERPISSWGMPPLRLFWKTSNTSKFWHFPRLGGILPSRLFPPKSSSIDKLWFPREDEMFPDNLFDKRINSYRFLSFPISAGITLVSWLFLITKPCRLRIFTIVFGMLLCIWLFSTYNIWSVFERLPIYCGSIPPKLLSLTPNVYKLVALVKEERKLKSLGLSLPRWLALMLQSAGLCKFSKLGTFPISSLLPISRY